MPPSQRRQLPPQSMPSSSPSIWLSKQVTGRHLPSGQIPLWQSAALVQLPPSQRRQSPPQSSPVSFPFFCLSKQVEDRHLPSGQCPLWQSVSFIHADMSHSPHAMLPQSTAVSAPFQIPSVQVASLHVPLSIRQLPLAQSAAEV